MTRTHRMALLTVVALGLGLATGCAKDAPREAAGQVGQLERPVEPTAQEVTVVGRNYCLGCALKKAEGAAAQCSKYGHRHALEVESAVGPDGAALTTLAGRTLHYLENDQASPLISGDALHGKRVEVKGRLFGSRSTIEVREVREQ